MSVTIKFRRGTSAEWTSNGSTILASGEPAYETDTGRFKIGNGITAWSGLSYGSVIPTGFLSASGISINLGSNGSTATIGVSGLNSSYISDFDSSVSGLINNSFSSLSEINLTNGSSLSIGTFDNGTADNSGISLISNNGYELNWQGGHLKSTSDSGATTSIIYFDSPIMVTDGGGNDISITNTGIYSNFSLILQPASTGALQGDISGDGRGQYSVDWQRARSNSSKVAAGQYGVIAGGIDNQINGDGGAVGGGGSNTANYYGAVAGGSSNTAGYAGYGFATIGGGYANSAVDYGFIGGGTFNSASSAGVICGGGSNQAYNSSFVGAGNNNAAYGLNSNICGGEYNTDYDSSTSTTSWYGHIGGGSYNILGANHTVIAGGYYNKAAGLFSCIPGGQYAKTTKYGEFSHAAGLFAYPGDAQHTVLVARRETTDDTANVVLYLDTTTNSLLTIPSQTMWSFTVKISAYNSTDNEGAWWNLRGGIVRDASNNVSLVGNIISESSAQSSLSSATATAVADDSNDALELRVTGVSGKTIRWVAVVDISQVSFSQI